MVEALKEKGLPYAYVLFEGEQHGFRKAESIRRALEAELSFYAQVLGFERGRRARARDREPLRGTRGAGPRPGSPRRRGGAASSAMQGSQPEVNAVCRRDERWRKPGGAQPPIIDIDRSGWTKSGWLIRCPDHFAQSPRRISSSSSSSVAPARIGARRSVSSSANRQVRNMPSAVSRSRLHVSQNGSVTRRSRRPARARRRRTGSVVAGSCAWPSGASGCTASIAARMRAAGTTLARSQACSASSGMYSMNRTS